mgnify:CR=1 FL=1
MKFVLMMVAMWWSAASLVGPAPVAAADVSAAANDAPAVVQVAQAPDGDLEPRYQPAPPETAASWSNAYIFALSRGLANSTLHPAARAPLFLFTVPLDIALLPFGLVGGLFGAG